MLEYTPYGEVSRNTGPYATDKRFTGKTWDETSALMYYGARYYDPALGRFITADPTIQHPFDPQDLSRYQYCRSNPIRYIDPTGLGFWDWLMSFFRGFVGAVIGTALVIMGAPPPIAYAIGGAISGAVFGAIQGGLKGALQGAAWGAAMGFAAGTLNVLDPTGFLLGAATIAGGVYAGVTGGAEGLINYAAGAVGAAAGGFAAKSTISTLVGQPTVKPSTGGANNASSSASSPATEERISSADSMGATDNEIVNSNKPSAIVRQEVAEKFSARTQSGEVGKSPAPAESQSSSGGFFKLTHTELDASGKGYVYSSDGTVQPTRTLGSLGGVTYDLNVGILPSSNMTSASLNISLGKFFSMSYFFTNPDVQPVYGGLSFHAGLGISSPVSISGTYPADSPRWR